MFLAICHTCGRRELRGPRAIEALVNTDHDIELHFSCRGCRIRGVVGAAALARTAAGVAPLPPARPGMNTAA